MKREVYADYAATAPVYPSVAKRVNEILTDTWQNPSSEYSGAQKARATLDNAREKIAAHLDSKPEAIYFTSGGSESNSWAIAQAECVGNGRNKIVISKIEHPSVINACHALARKGFELEFLPCGTDGLVKNATPL